MGRRKKFPIDLIAFSCSQLQVVVVTWEDYLGKMFLWFAFIVFAMPSEIGRNPHRKGSVTLTQAEEWFRFLIPFTLSQP